MRGLANRSGFSLVEMMVVVAVVGIALATATPSMRSFFEDHKLRTATSELESNLRRARSAAITRDCNVRMWIMPENNLYVVLRDNGGDNNFNNWVSRGQYDASVNAAEIEFNGRTFITFDSRGVPDNPGSMRLQTHGGKELEILVAAGSGHISVQKPLPGTEAN